LSGFDWNWAAAEKEFRQAIDLNPGYATAHHWYAWHLSLMGRNGEAIAEMRKARSLDPLSLIINADLAEVLLLAHLYDESAQQSRKTIEMDPILLSRTISWPRRTCKNTWVVTRSQSSKGPFSCPSTARSAQPIWLGLTRHLAGMRMRNN
jgi:FOG: TPR repeat